MRNVRFLVVMALAACGGSAKKVHSGVTPPATQSRAHESSAQATAITKQQPVVAAATQPACTLDAADLAPIHFGFDSSLLDDHARDVLARLGQCLDDHPKESLTIAGNTDDRGTTEYNVALGDARARAAEKYLIRMGVDAGRLHVVSYGEEDPVDHGQNEDAWAKNRRDEFKAASKMTEPREVPKGTEAARGVN
jgi:peptidoglycan-associated lipoprotein